jgi:hypothetical protein
MAQLCSTFGVRYISRALSIGSAPMALRAYNSYGQSHVRTSAPRSVLHHGATLLMGSEAPEGGSQLARRR